MQQRISRALKRNGLVDQDPVAANRLRMQLHKKKQFHLDFLKGKTIEDVLFLDEDQEVKEVRECFDHACHSRGSTDDDEISNQIMSLIVRSLQHKSLIVALSPYSMDFDEFMSNHHPENTPIGDHNHWRQAQIERIKENQKAAQSFPDGVFVSVKQLGDALPLIDDTVTKEEVAAMLANADRNGDGLIDYQEFVDMLS